MKTRQSWTDITYRTGRYDDEFNPYKEDKTKLVWNVFNERNGEIFPINIFNHQLKSGSGSIFLSITISF